MTGPEHYCEAEFALDTAARASDKGRQDDAMFWLLSARVHAALALAAATAVTSSPMYQEDATAWTSAASAYKPPVEMNGGTS